MYIDAATAPDQRNDNAIKLHGPEAFEGMRVAGRAAADILDMLVGEVREGVTAARVDDLARDYVMDHGWIPACMGYRGYGHTTCISLNHVVCHGIPGPRQFRSGDIANIDVTVIIDGWHGDHSRMYSIGDVSRKAQRLMDVTWESLQRGLSVVKPGNTVGDIGHAIQQYVESQRCSVVRDFCGHGLGKVFHDNPNIVHFGKPGTGPELRPGMFFTIEPMVNLGKYAVSVLPDGWTAVTKDRSLSAQFEHSVGVTEEGCEIFTLSAKGLETPHTLNMPAQI
jgi:methionyl aminopeptidase